MARALCFVFRLNTQWYIPEAWGVLLAGFIASIPQNGIAVALKTCTLALKICALALKICALALKICTLALQKSIFNAIAPVAHPCSLRLCAMAVELQSVLISDAVDSSCRDILTEGGVSVKYRPGLSKEDLLACIKVCTLSLFPLKPARCITCRAMTG